MGFLTFVHDSGGVYTVFSYVFTCFYICQGNLCKFLIGSFIL